MRVMFSYPAPANRVYGPEAFADQIGQPIDIALPGGGTAAATLAGAEVDPDGGQVHLALDVPEDSPLVRIMTAQRDGR